jgi:hypothetical protein
LAKCDSAGKKPDLINYGLEAVAERALSGCFFAKHNYSAEIPKTIMLSLLS